MKKLLLILFAMSVSFSAMAQVLETELEPKTDVEPKANVEPKTTVELKKTSNDELVTKKNHISVNYCDFSAMLIGEGFLAAFTGAENVSFWGGVSLTYTHNLSKRWQLGGQVTIGGTTERIYTVIMPVGSFDYYRNSWFKVSGEIGAGVLFHKDIVGFAPQVYPLVMRFGSEKVAFFCKLGIGMLGLGGAGLQIGF